MVGNKSTEEFDITRLAEDFMDLEPGQQAMIVRLIRSCLERNRENISETVKRPSKKRKKK